MWEKASSRRGHCLRGSSLMRRDALENGPSTLCPRDKGYPQTSAIITHQINMNGVHDTNYQRK